MTAFVTSLLLAASANVSAQGAAIYKKCGVCHMQNGRGVPGTFPPLDDHLLALAMSDKGRAYLALVILKGRQGVVRIKGRDYRGFMPAQPLDDGQVAAVLNYTLTSFSGAKGKGWKAFTAAEVAKLRARYAAAKAADIAALRPATP